MIDYEIEKIPNKVLLSDHPSFTNIPFPIAGTVETQSIIYEKGVRSKKDGTNHLASLTWLKNWLKEKFLQILQSKNR